MRVLQLIDSLEPGGAERVAVNMANALVSRVDRSYLCTTRKEGDLKGLLKDEVGYLFLEKQFVLDANAVLRLHRFIKQEAIDIIHVHASSFFLATLVKFVNNSIKIVWHDHYGNSEFLDLRRTPTLKFCSGYFSHIISVNNRLVNWAKENLKVKEVEYLPNFAVLDKSAGQKTELKGEPGKRIICLANLRPQKDHLNLLKAFKWVVNKYPLWTLHLVGKDENDAYSEELKDYIGDHNLENNVFIYGSRNDTDNILSQCDIGVLASRSEGLPLSLLEYGLSGLACVVTDVGQCAEVVLNGQIGNIVPANDDATLSKAISHYIAHSSLRQEHAMLFKWHVEHTYSEEVITDKITTIYNRL
ncbi:glycosyltransferase [Aestuariibaculum lutulentum]|uniref:Glycosyltransferase n=1 Tax=Aestuariibaculum lutulentum TaxID=2920935 RepID=A0ABS9RE54_9FLAO|nr:glycosyltransferase [Aestuariibaculum lutulentum]MCH4551223.1 glycosyltransferase [Aestuariibaculum lutulentum]